MLGNGNFDEALHRDIKHPGHTSGGREGIGAAIAVVILGFFFWNFVGPDWLPSFVEIFLTLVAAIGVFAFFHRWIGAANARHEMRMRGEARAAREAETQRQLAEIHKNGWRRK